MTDRADRDGGGSRGRMSVADLSSVTVDELAQEIYADPNGPCPRCYARVAELVRRLKTTEDALETCANDELDACWIAQRALAAIRPNPEPYPEDGRTRSDYEAFGG